VATEIKRNPFDLFHILCRYLRNLKPLQIVGPSLLSMNQGNCTFAGEGSWHGADILSHSPARLHKNTLAYWTEFQGKHYWSCINISFSLKVQRNLQFTKMCTSPLTLVLEGLRKTCHS
jgi:hypothetical protein